MAQKTSLSVFAIPGPVRTFSPKTPGAGGGPHNPGRITSLTVFAIPGRTRTFLPKTPGGGGPHDPGRITSLMVYAIPGRVRSFTAKTPEAVLPPSRRQFYRLVRTSRSVWRRYYTVEED